MGLRENSYGLRVKEITDANESYALSGQVKVEGPRWKLDIINGFNDFEAEGCNKWYATFNDNDGFFTRTVVQSFRVPSGEEGCEDAKYPAWSGDFLDLALGDIDGDGYQDIVVATTGAALNVFYGDGTGESWPAEDTLTATGNLLTLDVGMISGDSAYNIVIGTNDGKVLLFTNGGSRGSWFLSTITSLSTTTTSALRVGDVDGDNWDDIVLGTENGFLLYLRNDQGTGWAQTTIAQMTDRIDSADIGDADRGVIIRTHPY